MAAVAASSRLRLLLLVAVLAAGAAAAAAGEQYRVGGPDGWIAPPPEEKELYYSRWASSIAFYVGDSIEFEYRNDSVIKVSKAGYYHCNETAGVDAGDAPVPGDGARVFYLYVPGFAYFASPDLGRCNEGQRLMINVLAAVPPAAAPAPSTDYDTGAAAGSAFAAASFFAPVVSAAAMAMAGLV
ncbi:mavicyanin-like [Oryza glaberrima]|uniref:Phytocyanin domain-containing protein n=1 Tax=Oryza glumipatula TaxID=40148 RepID=A0A0D9YPN6_9ORYZ|nr:mavicyanin-like [Oryza glaberrima]